MNEVRSSIKFNLGTIGIIAGAILLILALIISSVSPRAIQAISATSLSESQGSTAGQNQLTIHGEGFLSQHKETITKLITSYESSYALTSTNHIYAWGANSSGQLGNGNTDDQSTPIDITSNFNGNVTQIITTGYSVYALTSTNHVYSWGYNGYYGQLGIGTSDYDAYSSTPVDITSNFDGDVTQIITTGSSTYALTSTNHVYAWGYNYSGQLGNGNTTDQSTPVDITSNFEGNVTQLITTGSSVYALTSTNHVYAWGYNYYGQLGIGTTSDYDSHPTPVDITSNFEGNVTQIITYNSTTYALTSTNHVYAWGNNSFGQLGNGNTTDQSTPVDVTSNFDGDVTQIITTGSSTYALTSTNHVYAWGYNYSGQLGNGNTTDQSTPVDITSNFDGNVTQIITNAYSVSVYALTSTNHVYAWGYNGNGQLGNGNTTNQSTPVDITSNLDGNVTQLVACASSLTDAGRMSVYALTSTNHVYAWGSNGNGELGNGANAANQSTPVDITSNFDGNVTQLITVSGTSNYEYAYVYTLTSTGKVYAWGSNSFGQLGNGDTTGQSMPVDITPNFNLQSSGIPTISSIRFGNIAITNFRVLDDNTITLTVPAHPAGKVDVALISTDGTTETLSQSYTYVDDSPAKDDNSDPGKLVAPNTGLKAFSSADDRQLKSSATF